MDTSSPTELSPNLLSLLRKKLGITRIGTQTLRYISEELNNGAEFDLDDPDELKEFLDYVRRQHRRECDLRTEINESLLTADLTPLQLSIIEQAIGRSPHSSSASGSTQHAQNELNPSKDLLTPLEQAAADAITEHYSAWMSRMGIVKWFRSETLGKERQLLSRDEADTFIFSPAVRFLTAEYSQSVGIRWDDCTVRVVDWQQSYLLPEQVEEMRGQPDVVFSDLRPDRRLYRSYYVRLEGLPEGKSIEKMLVGNDENCLLWTPFMPRERISIHNDQEFPRMFPGSIADQLSVVAELLAKAVPWEVWELCMFLLTGELPRMTPVRITTYDGFPRDWLNENTASPDDQFFQLQRFAEPRRSIQITAEPWVSSDTIRKYYSYCQQHQRRQENKIKNQKQSEKAVKRSVERPLSSLPRPVGISLVKDVAAIISQSEQESSNKPCGYTDVYHVLRPDAGKDHYSGFVRAYKRACEALDLFLLPTTGRRKRDK